jgi:N-acetylmuramoyl-L-alanine amidase
MVTPPAHGDLVYVNPGFFAYTPAADYSTLAGDEPGGEWVSDSFTYRAKDNDDAWSQPATMRFWVAPVNDPPTFVSPPIVVEVAEDSGPYDASWLPYASAGPANESDQTVDFVITSVNSYGLVHLFSAPPTFTAGGHLTFTPGPDEYGVATVTVHLQDDGGLQNWGINNLPDPPDDTSDSITFDILVDGVNDAPVAADDSLTVAEDSGATGVLVMANDTDIDYGDTFTVTGKTNGAKGVVAIADGGAGVYYTPNANANGLDSFTYAITDSHGGTDTATVNVTITAVNDPPVAVDDPSIPGCISSDYGGSFPITEDHAQFVIGASCGVLANDTDTDGTVVDWEILTSTTHGALSKVDPNGMFAYTPEANYYTVAGDWVSDSFTYRSRDDGGAWSAAATMRFWVAPVNDAPTFTAGAAVVHGTEDTTFSAGWATNVLPGPLNESGQTVHFLKTSTDLHGNLNLFSTAPAIAADGTLTFTPGPNQTGTATVTIVLKDDGGLESYLGQTINPRDTSDPVTFDITIDAVNDPPTATNDSKTVAEDSGANTILVRSNDTDVDPGDTLAVTAATQGAHGAVIFSSSSVAYTPNANYNGSDSFTYTIDDGHGGTDIGTVNVTITAVNDPPTATDDSKTVAEDASATAITVLANDSIAPDTGETLTITVTSASSHGTVAITGGGSGLTYRPNANYNGSDSFTYTIDDGHGGTDSATVNVAITPVNDAPNAVNDGVPTTIKIGTGAGPVPIAVLANDSWSPDSPETLRITAVTQGSNGTVGIIDRGTRLTYDPAGLSTGIDVFTYTISDGHGGSDTATAQVEVATDATGPVVGAPLVTVTHLARTGTVRLVVSWLASDPESGIASSLLQVKRDGAAAWTTVALADPTTTRAILVVPAGHTYQFQVRATSGIGVTSAFRIGALITV